MKIEVIKSTVPKSTQHEMELVQDEIVTDESVTIDLNWCKKISNCVDLRLETDIPATLDKKW